MTAREETEGKETADGSVQDGTRRKPKLFEGRRESKKSQKRTEKQKISERSSPSGRSWVGRDDRRRL